MREAVMFARSRLGKKAETGIRVMLIALLFSAELAALNDNAPNRPPAAESFSIENQVFAKPYVDLDEWRDTPERHRYVHGGFRGTDTRFSFHFPEKDRYDDRFFQYI